MTTTETTTTTTESAAQLRTARRLPQPAPRPVDAPAPVVRGRGRGIRTRILAGFVGLLAVATIGSILVARQVLLDRLDERIHADLVQEVEELRQLAGGTDPDTGEPFGRDVRRVFDVFLERNIPLADEAFLTFAAGEPYLRSRPVVPYRLDQDPEFVARWATLAQAERGRARTPAGRVEFLAVPLRAGYEVNGVFVVAIFTDRQRAEIEGAVAAAGGVGLAVLLIGSLLGWRVAEGVIRPVRSVTNAARSISETDLSRRITVRGDDEVAELAETFNGMLDRLERAFTTQRQFLDDAGHELKTPITIVRGHLELLEDDPVERSQTVALVLDELDRMGRMVNDLLLLAKADQPQFLHLEAVDVAALGAEVFTKASAIAPRQWLLEATGRGRIVVDRQRLTQALLQLAQNAVDHTSRGDEIALGSAVTGAEARFWVRDSGPGIPWEDQPTVFDRFNRGPAGDRSDGAGLGLSIVKAIAEAHQGRVELRSRPGGGATFTVVVPTDQPHQEGHA
jgi:two-component system, OmpR family, sensor kinase